MAQVGACRAALELHYRSHMRFAVVLSLLVASAAQAETQPTLRLPRTFLPTRNDVRLSLDPSRDTFEGRIRITGRLSQATAVVWLNADHLKIERAEVAVGGRVVTLAVDAKPADFVALRAPAPLPPGPAVVTLTYQGRVDDRDTDGIFRQKVGDDWYLYSNFEATYARRAFPCFDEPDSKVPWQLTLDVPRGQVALSNTRVTSEKDAAQGRRELVFAVTKPLPSYLVAFAVGPFDLVPAGKTKQGAPIRVVVPRGRGGETRFVAGITEELTHRLEAYFGIPYPYDKLDLIAVPQTLGFGAMENPGLITFNLGLLIARPEDFTITFQRGSASTIVHEIAHQWFGNLVTLAWWDDLWLNEAFATWMEDEILADWRPEWDRGTGDAQMRNNAATYDSLTTARQIRQPITTPNDIEAAFDGITYSKGAAVLEMFEQHLGPDRFRAGVKAYLQKHAGKNATAADFVASLSAAAGQDIRQPFGSFLDQPGIPTVGFALECPAGQKPRLRLTQERYLPIGAVVEGNQAWSVPICVRHPEGDEVVTACTVLAGQAGVLELAKATRCPAWVLPNSGGIGYYRSVVAPGPALDGLLGAGLDRVTTAERMIVLDDLAAQDLAGKLDPTVLLKLVERYAADPDPRIVAAITGYAGGLERNVPDALLPSYRRFLTKTFGARAKQLGWLPAPGEGDDAVLLRKALVKLVATYGEDAALAKEAQRLALAWLDDRKAVPSSLVAEVLHAGAYAGDRALYDRLVAAAQKTDDVRDLRRLFRALATFRAPDLVQRNFDLFLAKTFDSRLALGLASSGASARGQERKAYELLKRHYDEVAALYPAQYRAALANVARSVCDPALAADVKGFFAARTPKEINGPKTYAQAMEEMDRCISHRAQQRAALTRFLRRY
jgi:cytosol alanyl aminopeptidase